jgi:hypothetical protein
MNSKPEQNRMGIELTMEWAEEMNTNKLNLGEGG